MLLIKTVKDFPGGPMVKTCRFHCREHGFNPWLGMKSLHAAAKCDQKIYVYMKDNFKPQNGRKYFQYI